MTSIAWFPIEEHNARVGWQDRKMYCEAPKHKGSFTPAKYLFCVIDEPGYPDMFQATCSECVEKMAKEMDTTAKEGVSHLEGECTVYTDMDKAFDT